MNYKVLIAVLLMVIVGGLGFYFLNQNKRSAVSPVPQQAQTAVSPTVPVQLTPDEPMPGVPFTSEQYGFSLQYPVDLKHDTTSEGERFYKLGPTQSSGTELYDGISVTIKSGSLGGMSLADWVDKKYVETKNDPVQPRVGAKKTVTIAGMQGIAFAVSSIGDVTIIYLPKGDKDYLEIINGTVEPADREQTFQKIVDQMLSTITYK